MQEELITKENAVELLQRKVANLQAEMRLIARENAQLNDKLTGGQGTTTTNTTTTTTSNFDEKNTGKSNFRPLTPPTTTDIVDMKLQEYKETTHTLVNDKIFVDFFFSITPNKYSIRTPMETPTELNAKSIPLKCGCVTSPVYTLAGAPTIPEPKPTSNLPPKKKKIPD